MKSSVASRYNPCISHVLSYIVERLHDQASWSSIYWSAIMRTSTESDSMRSTPRESRSCGSAYTCSVGLPPPTPLTRNKT